MSIMGFLEAGLVTKELYLQLKEWKQGTLIKGTIPTIVADNLLDFEK
jgi:hypothetical protein